MASRGSAPRRPVRRNLMHQVPHPPPVSRSNSFDRDSGLIYSEVSVRGSRAPGNWINEYKHPKLVKTTIHRYEGTGVRSLSALALNKLGLESHELTVEALLALPWAFGQHIWARIRENHAESFYIWRIFATAYGADFTTNDHLYMLEIKTPSLPLTEYFEGLNSKDRSWLTCLRISPKQITVPDLVAISTISNLSLLDLSDGQLYMETRESTFDFRVMRTWAEMAKSGRAFQNLRVLLLGWQEKVEPWVFDWLHTFPQLTTVIMTDCYWIDHKNHRDWEQLVWDNGWDFMPAKRGVKHLRQLLDDRSFYLQAMPNIYHDSIGRATTSQCDASPSDLPILDCWIGTPRLWTHIIDEFPGTRTVLFQRKPTVGGQSGTSISTNATMSTKREPSSPITANVAKRVQKGNVRRKDGHHTAGSLLKDMGLGNNS